MDVTIEIETDAGFEDLAREVAHDADRGCLVAVSLDLPVETTVHVNARAVAAS
jgi:organic hydroperoxide reductase OsmC/OhrA